jgi:hypothetical protein
VRSADFNNDGQLDLATTNNDGTVSVLLGDGQGGFGAAGGFQAGSIVRSLAVADFNNDGNLDLATNGFGFTSLAEVNVLLGDGDGTFRSFVNTGLLNGSPLTLRAGDFNADGNIDLVCTYNWVVNPDDPDDAYDAVEVLLGNGGGGFADRYEYRLPWCYPNGLAVGDLNADGKPDVVMANYNLNSVSVLLGLGGGTLGGESVFATGQSPVAVEVGDFTGDGIPDLVTAGQTMDVLPGLGDGTFALPISHSAVGSTVVTADFNADGKLDVVTARGGTVAVLLGRGDGALFPPLDHAAGSAPRTVAVGDFNGDGRPDVAAADRGSNTVPVLLNDGAWPDLSTPQLQIRDVTVTEGNTGTVAAVFIVTRSRPSDQITTVSYNTADGTATAGSDYAAASGTVTFNPGETSKTITVLVNGDRLGEPNETFVVKLSAPTNATIADGQGIGTILEDEPKISINDVTLTEGNTGAVNATFTVSLSVAYDVAMTVHYQTANGSATAGSDYAAASGDVIIAAGQTTKTFTVAVIGDRSAEPTENFVVNLSTAANGLIVDSQGVGTILDDEPRISISDVTKAEGQTGQTTLFAFTVTLSVAYDQAVTMSFRTVNGTAKANQGDYVAKTGTLTFAPGETTKTITIEVKSDSNKEANETFYLDLYGNSGNSLFSKNRGIGTILNDD